MAKKKAEERNKEYWVKRAEQNLIDGEKTVLAYEKELRSLYKSTLKNIQTEIDAFYHKYAKDNKITLAEARKRLNPKELKSFREQQELYLSEIERIGTANVQNYIDYLKNLSAKAYVSKLEELQANVRYHIEKMTVGYEESFTELMEDNYQDSYYKTMFDTHQRLGFGIDFAQPGGKLLQAAIKERWNGQNYSDRIWANKDKLIREINTVIPQAFVRGRNSRQLAVDMARKLDTSEYNAKRLLRTEINYISNKGTIKAYKDSGLVEKYEYLATLDNRTSDICIEMDGKIIPLAEAQVGINLPPLHPNCRSTTIPYFEPDEFDTPGDRVATDENGKTFFVGKDVTYKEWATEHASGQYVKKKFEKITKMG